MQRIVAAIALLTLALVLASSAQAGTYMVWLPEYSPAAKTEQVAADAQKAAGGHLLYVYKALSGFAITLPNDADVSLLRLNPDIESADQNEGGLLVMDGTVVRPGTASRTLAPTSPDTPTTCVPGDEPVNINIPTITPSNPQVDQQLDG